MTPLIINWDSGFINDYRGKGPQKAKNKEIVNTQNEEEKSLACMDILSSFKTEISMYEEKVTLHSYSEDAERGEQGQRNVWWKT